MNRGFLETSAINRAWVLGMSPSTLRSYLEKEGVEPACGLHVVYELAGTFRGTPDKGAGLFQLLLELDPAMQPPTDDILRQELIKLKYGSAVIPFLDHDSHIATKEEVTRLSMGIFGERARAFIREKEEEFKKDFPAWAQGVIRQAGDENNPNDQLPKKVRTAADVYRHYEDTGKTAKLVRQAYRDQGDKVSPLDSTRLADNLDEYPALRSLVMANCYLVSICVSQKVVPGSDRVPDFRQIIDASYCDSFVTFDRGQAKATPNINPSLGVLWFDP